MKQLLALSVCFLSAIFSCSQTAVTGAEKLNVLLIAVDDLNNNLGCYGHPVVKSPQIDRLARRGVRFDRGYCQYPLCNPSRVSMLSGRRPDSTRVMDLETPPRTYLKDVVFLPGYFRQHGYFAAQVGKIFHTGEAFEDPQSWDTLIRETGKHPPEASVLRQKKIQRGDKNNLEWQVLKSADEATADGLVARQGAELLNQLAQKDKPFFLAVGFRRPHAPYSAPQKYFDLYPNKRIPIPLEPAEHLSAVPPAALTYPQGLQPLSESDRREMMAAYFACVSFVDAQIGRVLAALDQHDLWSKTVVVLYGDHGYHLGEHGGIWHKMSLFEESARVPMIIAAPGIPGEGQACARLVEMIDIYPTLVDLCCLPAQSGLEGKSLRPLLENPKRRWTEAAFTQVLHGPVEGRSVRTERWRYTEWDRGRQGSQLYDHAADPGEFVNLAADPKLAPVVSRLQELLHAGKPPLSAN